MKRQRSEPPSTGTPADDQSGDTAIPNLARGLRELIDRAGTEAPANDQCDTAVSGLARRFRELFDRKENLGLLAPGTEEDKLVGELIEANRKAEDPESRRRRQKWYADLQASYDRRLGVPLGVAQRQEKLILDLQTYAASYLPEAHSQVAQLRVTRLALEFFRITPNTEQFPLSFERTHTAIWKAGDPSLEEIANELGADESADTGTRPALSGTERGEMGPEPAGGPVLVGHETGVEDPAATIGSKGAAPLTDFEVRSEILPEHSTMTERNLNPGALEDTPEADAGSRVDQNVAADELAPPVSGTSAEPPSPATRANTGNGMDEPEANAEKSREELAGVWTAHRTHRGLDRRQGLYE